jgi:hypothetical protein
MLLQDMTLTCRDCRSAFVFTTGEQESLLSRGRDKAPGRCPPCDRRVRYAIQPDRE